jgi:hypothetical protein
MTEKKCNPNNNKYKEKPNDYECNTMTGRWIKKKTPKKETNIDNDNYIFHPETGKRYKKNGKKGKQILEKMNQIKFTNIEKIPDDILHLSEKMSIKEIRDKIKKHGLNIKGKSKKELIEKSKTVYKRRQYNKNSIPLERDGSFENLLVEKPKKKSIDKDISSTHDKKSTTQSSDSAFFSVKEETNTPLKNKTIFPFLNSKTSSSDPSLSKESDKKDESLPSAFIPSEKSTLSQSKKSLSSSNSPLSNQKSLKDEPDDEFCVCEKKFTKFKKQEWNVVKMPPDNHCGFHSIIYGIRSKTNHHPNLDLTKDTKDLILELRYLLIQHYRYKNKKKYKEILTDVLYWLEDTDIKVLADYLNICFCIYDNQSDIIRKKNKAYDISVFTHVRPDNESDCTICIYLYQKENHYDIMFPKNDTRNDVILTHTLLITDNDLIEFLLEKDFQLSDFSSSSSKSSDKSTATTDKSTASDKSTATTDKSTATTDKSTDKSTATTDKPLTLSIQRLSSEQQESEIARNAHLKVISNIKKLQIKKFVNYSNLSQKEVKKIIKGTIKTQSIPQWLL